MALWFLLLFGPPYIAVGLEYLFAWEFTWPWERPWGER